MCDNYDDDPYAHTAADDALDEPTETTMPVPDFREEADRILHALKDEAFCEDCGSSSDCFWRDDDKAQELIAAALRAAHDAGARECAAMIEADEKAQGLRFIKAPIPKHPENAWSEIAIRTAAPEGHILTDKGEVVRVLGGSVSLLNRVRYITCEAAAALQEPPHAS